MRKFSRYIATLSLLSAALVGLVAQAASAAPRQLVVVVAEGLSPQVIDMGSSYVKTVAQSVTGDEEAVAFSEFRAQAKTQTGIADSGTAAIESLRGLLKTASANGYRTGLVTTDDVTKVAGLFYDIPGDASSVASTLINTTRVDFLAGGGRSYFVSNKVPGSRRTDDFDASAVLRQAGGTAFLNAEAIENTDVEVKGKTIVLQADDTLSYSIDQNPEREAGFSEMAGLAAQTLAGENNAPFVLVIHNNALSRAIAAKDTPAVLEEFRTLDGIVSDVVGMRNEQATADNFGVVVLAAGGGSMPKFTSDVATDRSNAVFVVSQLPLSFRGAGAALTGANEERLTQFATEEYKGWKLSNEMRAAILAGSMTPEAAIRAAYEPVIAIGYENMDVKPTVYTLGVDASAGLANALTQIVSTPAK
ncbi:MAG TPA: hypothetical protein VF600_02550 [Abditibacteriaceae bacterium]